MTHIMRTLERLILDQLRPMDRPHLDHLQFAYQPQTGVEMSAEPCLHPPGQAGEHCEGHVL